MLEDKGTKNFLIVFVHQEAKNKRFILMAMARVPAEKGVGTMQASSKAALMISTGLIALILAIFTEEFDLIAEFMQQLSESGLAGTPRP